MKKMYNDWRSQPWNWMETTSYNEWHALKESGWNQDAHQLTKSCFSTFLFHLSGCKFLLHHLIQLPLVQQLSDTGNSVAQPGFEILADLILAYEKHKNTQQYRDAVKFSDKKLEEQRRWSRPIWWAQFNYTTGRSLSTQVQDIK